jgi:hypothetical protein
MAVTQATETDRNRRILQMRKDGFLLREIAEEIDLSKERIRQIVAPYSIQPNLVSTQAAVRLLSLSQGIRPGSFERFMAYFKVYPVAMKKGRVYWNIRQIKNIREPYCPVCRTGKVSFDRIRRGIKTCNKDCTAKKRRIAKSASRS